jgi:predicted dehydrogenase
MVRIALAGTGFMGKTHLTVYSRLSDAEVVAICDKSEERLASAGSAPGGNIETASSAVDLSNVRSYTNYAQMLSDGGFDVVDICLPTYLHAQHSLDALAAGYHVFCEKPMAMDEESARRVVAAAHENGRLLTVGQCLRFWPAYAYVKKLSEEATYGALRAAEFGRFSLTPDWSSDNWIRQDPLSGQAALDLHIHDSDLVLHYFGMPESVRSVGTMEPDGGVSHISTVYGLPGKAVTATGGWICSSSFGFTMRATMVFEGATVVFDSSADAPLTVYPEGGDSEVPQLAPEDGYYYELEDFLRGVAAGKLSDVVTGESAADAVRLCRAEIRSAIEGREIDL